MCLVYKQKHESSKHTNILGKGRFSLSISKYLLQIGLDFEGCVFGE